jgi:hypothetical protein
MSIESGSRENFSAVPHTTRYASPRRAVHSAGTWGRVLIAFKIKFESLFVGMI